MTNIIKEIKKSVKSLFKKKTEEKEFHEKVGNDTEKKIFKNNEGVGQSSTLKPQHREGVKTGHGTYKHKVKKRIVDSNTNNKDELF